MITIISGPTSQRLPGDYVVRIRCEGVDAELPIRVSQNGKIDFGKWRAMGFDFVIGPEVLRELADFLEGK